MTVRAAAWSWNLKSNPKPAITRSVADPEKLGKNQSTLRTHELLITSWDALSLEKKETQLIKPG